MTIDFLRMNFFTGFFTHASDWQAGEAYRSTKHQLHNKCFHGCGIVPGYLDDLAVDAAADGTALSIGAGLALDPQGRELHLSAPAIVPIEPQAFAGGKTVYVVIKYKEEPVDRRENVANPEYSGFAFTRERADIKIIENEPGDDDVELARIWLTADATRIERADDPDNPRPNEIDSRFRYRCGVAGRWSLHEQAYVMEPNGRITVGENDTAYYGIEEVDESDPHRFYLVSCYPLGNASIEWQIQASRDVETAAIQYRVKFNNSSDSTVEVAFRVYRIG